MILQELHGIQAQHGYLPVADLQALAQRLRVPLHRVHEVASYYPQYRLQPPPAVDVRVCRDMVCHLRGAAALRKDLKHLAEEIHGGRVTVSGVSCLGRCDAAPAVVAINDHIYAGLTADEIRAHIRDAAEGHPLPRPMADQSKRRWKIDIDAGAPRYDAVRQFVATGDAERILQALEVAGLRGMGGAGFPTARKWAAVRQAPGEVKYVICNADESEPGTFKDRELLQYTPHLVIEGLVLAGLVTGATRGFIYLRHEYHEAIDAVRAAIDQAVVAGVCGDNILGSGHSFALEMFVSPGGYIQGEETALLEAMEDRRGEPRNKPPFPVTHGLFGRPTVINNVETLAWVPAIVLQGGGWYRDQGINGATGLRFVSVCGDVNRPGVYEIPFGLTVRELVCELAGGVRDGQQLKAIAPSGPSGGFLPALIARSQLPEKFIQAKLGPDAAGLDILDLTLDLPTFGLLGAMLGGAFVVYGDRADMLEQALNCVEFFRNESCGKCVPCRAGSQKLVEIIGAMRAGRFDPEHLPEVNDLGQVMALTSICGLGQVAANPILSVIRYFPDDVARHLVRAAHRADR